MAAVEEVTDETLDEQFNRLRDSGLMVEGESRKNRLDAYIRKTQDYVRVFADLTAAHAAIQSIKGQEIDVTFNGKKEKFGRGLLNILEKDLDAQIKDIPRVVKELGKGRGGARTVVFARTAEGQALRAFLTSPNNSQAFALRMPNNQAPFNTQDALVGPSKDAAFHQAVQFSNGESFNLDEILGAEFVADIIPKNAVIRMLSAFAQNNRLFDLPTNEAQRAREKQSANQALEAKETASLKNVDGRFINIGNGILSNALGPVLATALTLDDKSRRDLEARGVNPANYASLLATNSNLLSDGTIGITKALDGDESKGVIANENVAAFLALAGRDAKKDRVIIVDTIKAVVQALEDRLKAAKKQSDQVLINEGLISPKKRSK